MSAYGGKAYAREFPAEFPLTAVKRKSVNGSNLKKADNLRTRLNHDRQSQFSVVSGPGFEPAGIKSPNQPLIGAAFGGQTCKVCTSHGPAWELLHPGATLGAAAGREIRSFPPLLGSELPFPFRSPYHPVESMIRRPVVAGPG